jgi:polynucleotide 5'-kinase involved in rRNA processing
MVNKRLQNLTLDTRHIAKHLPNTRQSQRLIRKEGAAHVFKDKETLDMVVEAIKTQGEFIGMIRGHERWGFQFSEPIGYRIDRQGNHKPLYYGEMKVRGDKYHVIPRTKPSQ